MKEGRASRTAEYMALFRALEATRAADRRLFKDRFAAAFLSPRLRLVVGLSRVPVVGALIRAYIDHRWPGARTSALARTRFIDDQTGVALGSGTEQVVILGAGFDARAYRIAAMARVAVVFEVDHPSTSAAKRTIVQAILASVPHHVVRPSRFQLGTVAGQNERGRLRSATPHARKACARCARTASRRCAAA